MPDSSSLLAQITAVDERQAGRVLGVTRLLTHSTMMVLLQAGWTFLMLLGLLVGRNDEAIGISLVVLAFVWMTTQFVFVFAYPEWPMNRLLCLRLRRSVAGRDRPLVLPWDRNSRVVELVPRERWRKLSLETATDVMLIRVDQSGVWMTGDLFEYALPRESILSAELHSIRPPGWFTSTHMVILHVRTSQGPIELPISYRDHSLGSLISRKRRVAALDLVQRINHIARGCYYQPPTAPETEVVASANHFENPFASPTIFSK